MSEHDIYVTGTDTGIGKTRVSVAWVHALRTRGLAAAGMKPVASGCEATHAGLRNEDALALQEASVPAVAYEDVNPYALPLPLAPELAARDAGVDIRLGQIVAASSRLRAQADAVVVEGVGGWLAPLSRSLMQVDVVRALDLPVVLVIGLRLGCLNHALLSARAIAADGCRLLGWVGNAIDPEMACREEHRAMLQARIDAPCLGWIPHAPLADAAAMQRYLAIPE